MRGCSLTSVRPWRPARAPRRRGCYIGRDEIAQDQVGAQHTAGKRRTIPLSRDRLVEALFREGTVTRATLPVPRFVREGLID